MKKICSQKGITMISLIITIIVMLILAGTVLTVSFNEDSGIIKETKEATSGIKDLSLYESIAELIVTSKKKDGKIDPEKFPTKVNSIDDNVSCSYEDETSTYIVKEDGVERYEISEYGKITEK